MEFFMDQHLSISHVKSLNWCRVDLQVSSPSDILTADGSRIIPPILQAPPLTDWKSRLAWPIQIRPPNPDWAIWESVLKTLCIGRQLSRPVDMVLTVSSQLIKKRFWYMDTSSSLLHLDSSQWSRCQPVYHLRQSSRRRSGWLFKKTSAQPCPPTYRSRISSQH